MTETVSTTDLAAGDQVLTTAPDGTDFGLPLVSPTTRRAHGERAVRTVRNHVRCRGGQVVWFTDGTKTRPINGRTIWVRAEARDEFVQLALDPEAAAS